jgi:phage tail-like protein
MEAELGDSWQFRFVAEYGAGTGRNHDIAAGIPLRVEQGKVPVGGNAGTVTDPLTVTGPYLKITFGLPEDAFDRTFTGKVKIHRRSRAFSRDEEDFAEKRAIEIYSHDFVAELGVLPRSEYLEEEAFLDHGVGNPGDIWYYTIFYEYDITHEDRWFFSPENSHARNWAYENETDGGEPTSYHGSLTFSQRPEVEQIKDHLEGDDTLYRLYQVFGRVFDLLKEDLDQILEKTFDVDEVDASLLPYIDWLLGWPTNFELDEIKRRIETKNASVLWKAKGTKDALELAIQTITGWNVEVIEGYPWVITAANTALHDSASPPSDWSVWAVTTPYILHEVVENDGESYSCILDHTSAASDEPGIGVSWETYWELLSGGSWEDHVDALPYNITFDSTDPNHGANRGTENDKLVYTFSNEEVVPTGVGWWWQNPNGVLIKLTEVPGITEGLSETLVRKVYRVAPLFALHYAAFAVMLDLSNTESWQPLDDDWYQDEWLAINEETWQPLGEEWTQTASDDYGVFYSWPHPVFPEDCACSSPWFWTFHSDLVLGKVIEEEPLADFVHGEQVAGDEGTIRVGGERAFDPNEWPAGATFRFEAVVSVSHIGDTGEVFLYDLDNAEYINLGLSLDTTSTDPELISTGNLTVGGAGNIKDARTIYEVRTNNDSGAPDQWTVVGVATLRAFY